MGFKGCIGSAEFTGFGGFAGFKKAAVVAGAALALAVAGGQGSAQAQAQTQTPAQAQAQTQVRVQAQAQAQVQVQRAKVFGPVVDPIVERVCGTPLPIRLPLCGEPGAGTDKPVNGWQIEKPKQ
ncbi:hypothetical protein [Streptomyces sp. VNUA24]|uniref:hypothetical protein n=1 Tax=Streptomyces sp. VNUA24 TaxID=3031131 RepID=UPI0023B87DAA|nr:hypothetical protein [Streptomyces sp. VNUA24]WEH16909.1 hypothetical protein PYR72_25660 [Streptomyces sp. VNUA24]